ncbi:hypothetical protein ACJRO7_009658 [Eucalyptus globulus]|uniref:Uncharacterized protein n=1 Tax=Eucalyptus globulus TaxID=34317 RepID=A0ABD3LAI8_EUCGL
MKLLSSFDGQLALSRPFLVSNSTQAPGCGTSLQAKAQTTLSIITDLGVNGMEVTIEMAAKAKRRLRLGLWWVAVLDVDVSCTYLTFAAQSNSGGSGDRMIIEGTPNCSLDIIPQLW